MTVNEKIEKILKIVGGITVGSFAGLKLIAKLRKNDSVYKNEMNQGNPLEGKKVIFVPDDNDAENADGVHGHLVAVGESEYCPGFYEKKIKRAIDVVLSFGGLVLLSPIYTLIALAIVIDDPGPILFTQKRMGQNKKYFKLHKFRSMKMATPHDVPTHMLDNPDQYITKVGKFLRAHSLDELPQIWDIFIGNMSVIGPRPGLWNQDVLTAERDKYNANDVKPGLTGWAQINGRDELEIPEKAKLDGEYVQKIGLWMDIKCFLGSMGVFAHDNSVVEGGTGEMNKQRRNYTDGLSPEELIGHIGFGEEVNINTNIKRNVLITGAGSYIGQNFKEYAQNNYKENFSIDEVDLLDPDWKNKNWKDYDIVYHVAGIAHADVGNVSDEVKEKYYKVNTDLTIEVAEKAKEDGVKEFIFMSSMIVYGESAPYGKEKVIDENTIPHPANFYGDSKLQADVAVRKLAGERFKVIVLRPPMIYGRGSKGNYPILAKLSKKLPVFPNVTNKRSMLYIENLCEFLCQCMLVDKFGKNAVVLIPQNKEWTRTTMMVKKIADDKIRVLSILNPMVWIAGKIPGKIGDLVNKAFGNNCYAHELSNYPRIYYQKINISDSIVKTEEKQNKRVLILASVASMIDQFNIPNIKLLQELGYSVDVACNFIKGSSCSEEQIEKLKNLLKKLEVEYYQIDFSRNIYKIDENFCAYRQVKKLMEKNNYSFVHCHSPIGGAIGRIAAYCTKTPAMYTAHGFHFYQGASKKNWMIYYPIEKILSKITNCLITINSEDYELATKKFWTHNIKKIPGVGIDVDKFRNAMNSSNIKYELKISEKDFVLISVGEINENKNHRAIIEAMHILNNPQVKYLIVGMGTLEKTLEKLIMEYKLENQIFFLGFRDDVPQLLKSANAFCFPSKREGLGLAAIEAMASGLPLITSNVHGIKDYSVNGKTGYACAPNDYTEFAKSIHKLMVYSEEREKMGRYNTKISEKYSLKKVNLLMKQIYEEMGEI